MTFEFATKVDAGRARSNNEDAVAVDPVHAVAVLADGMGGYRAGEVASDMAVSFVTTELSRWLASTDGQATASDVQRALEICVDNANQAIYNAAISNPQYAGMGTTIVAAVFRPGAVLIGHIGDSRAYRWRAGRLERITRDHSLLQQQLDAGLITPEQAAQSANKNLVTRAVGVEPAVELEVHLHDLQAGDIVLMCSDGLTDMVGEARIAQILASAQALEGACETLVASANEAGGRDNISVVLARVHNDAGASPRPWWRFGR